ncbi:YciI family protein [Roseimicrobium sp. ORNL1]|uniref:YciI family protein n=1 Tax=Roseimicrobium sp. ORNL1 TaxID=2711231 RepID=UPI0013E1B2FB|nr:YciI family protein [Roseimicrobium sp. ORNL1]QIF03143.1 YciI family protein [Roseimicrobium sp. ORNL1]
MRFLMMMIPRGYQPDTPASERQEDGFEPTAEEMAPMGKFNDEMEAAGVLLTVDGLHPLSRGARVTFPGGNATVTDGPFIETKEVVGGFWIIQVKSKQEAVDWARRCPALNGDVIELREIWEMEDLPEEVQKAAAEKKK